MGFSKVKRCVALQVVLDREVLFGPTNCYLIDLAVDNIKATQLSLFVKLKNEVALICKLP